MDNESHEPSASKPVRGTGGTADTDSALTPALTSAQAPATRHDGWSGEKMAIFCETLAETAVVAEACDQARMGISGAYALRRRNPFFAAAWDAALTIARERLADTLLARSVEGNIEQIWRDGELVGERHVIDNRLGLAILRRLDRLAETGTTVSTRGERPAAPVRSERGRDLVDRRSTAPAPRPQPFDWELMVNALRTGEPDDIAQALALLKGHEVEEVEDPRAALVGRARAGVSPEDEEPEEIDLSDRCWREEDGVWMTNFPPPADFTGYQSCEWGDPDSVYDRECTADEIAILEADAAALRAHERAEEEALRDQWFEVLKQPSTRASTPARGADDAQHESSAEQR